MVCSHYEVKVFDADNTLVWECVAYSFDEAYYWIDKAREECLTAKKFVIEYPDKEYYKERAKESE